MGEAEAIRSTCTLRDLSPIEFNWHAIHRPENNDDRPWFNRTDGSFAYEVCENKDRFAGVFLVAGLISLVCFVIQLGIVVVKLRQVKINGGHYTWSTYFSRSLLTLTMTLTYAVTCMVRSFAPERRLFFDPAVTILTVICFLISSWALLNALVKFVRVVRRRHKNLSRVASQVQSSSYLARWLCTFILVGFLFVVIFWYDLVSYRVACLAYLFSAFLLCFTNTLMMYSVLTPIICDIDNSLRTATAEQCFSPGSKASNQTIKSLARNLRIARVEWCATTGGVTASILLAALYQPMLESLMFFGAFAVVGSALGFTWGHLLYLIKLRARRQRIEAASTMSNLHSTLS